MGVEEGELVRLGMVMGTHGLRGDLKIMPQSPDAQALLDARQIFLRRAGEPAVAYSPMRTTVHKAVYLLRLEGLDHINAVESLVGCEVLIRRDDLPEPEGDDVYWMDLQGMTVVDRLCGELGTLDDLFTTAAHDVYVVNGRFGEVLIPAVGEFIVEIDLPGRRMSVDLPEGLVREPDEV
jgi:16S rRNA processing protein RimM